MTTPASLESETGAMYVPGGHVEVTAEPRQDAGSQVRRRRLASLRCEPLADGRRDPWTSSRQEEDQHRHTILMSRTLHVEVGKHTAWLHGGDGQDIFKLLDTVGVERRQWDAVRKVWMIPVQFADDVMAWAEWKQRRIVTCEAVDR